MDGKVVPTLVTLAVLALVFVGMWWGWRGRQRAQADLPPLQRDAERPARVWPGMYVATTLSDRPLERVNARGLGFRAQGAFGADDRGVYVERDGSEPFLIPAEALRRVGRASYAIDKGVERDGLVALDWEWGERSLTTYARMRTPEETALLIAAARSTEGHERHVGHGQGDDERD